MRNICFVCLLMMVSITSISSQNMKVTRSQLIPWSSPVTNIAVDADNIKWVGHDGNLAKIYGLGLAANDGLAEGEKSLALYRGGDADIRWNSTSLRNVTGDIFDEYNYITSGAYDAQKSEMWLGTSQTGVFRIKVSDGGLQLIKQMTTGSSRLRSNQIHDILIDDKNRVWIGTDDGLLLIENGKESILEKNLIIESIASIGSDVWLMGDDLVGKVNSRGTWVILEVPFRKTEGQLRDIALDSEGNVWIASEVITRYNPEEDTYTVFGPAQEYTSQFATAISVDQDGAVWVGTRDKGLYVIQEADAFVAFCEIDNPVDCNSKGQDGALSVRVDGGTPPYNYKWSGSLTGENPSGLTPGTYDVTVTDSKGNVATSSATLMDLSVKVAVSQDQPADNAEANGVATVSVQQGQPAYSYKWDNGEATATATKLNPGTHTVTVTDKNGCEATASVEITEALAAFTVEAETTDISCAGGADATIELAVSGGQQPYTYQWNQEGLSGDQATGLGEGTYEVVVSDAAGNKKSILRNIIEPEGMNLRTQMSAPATTGNSDGEANVRVRSGGQEPYSYNWDSGEATQQATQLSPGTHTVTVTDANGCTATATVEITENILPLQLSLEQSSTINCFDGADARLEAIVDGGKPPFTYQWEGTPAEGEVAEGLREGKYALVVVDATGQTARDEIVINQPEKLIAKAVVESPASTGNSDGQASIQASGGVTPYQYIWDSGETEALAKQLSPGQHSFTVTDANGCTATATVDITEDILPLQLTLNAVKNLSCNGDSDAELSVDVRGGKPPYQYDWEGQGNTTASIDGLGEGTYAVVVEDASGMEARKEGKVSAPPALGITAIADAPANTGQSDGRASIQVQGGTAPYQYSWDNGETKASVDNLGPGNHSITVTDANGCTATANVNIGEDIQPLSIAIKVLQPVSCGDSSDALLEAVVRGGKPPYTYSWVETGSKEKELSGLPAGSYTLIVQDASGLEKQSTTTLTAPPTLQLSVTLRSPASTGNADGVAMADVKGGTPPYSYSWTGGATQDIAEGLSPGMKTVTVTDANGCQTEGKVEVNENILPLQLAIEEVQPVRCKDGNEGELLAKVSGGKPPYFYNWSHNSLNSEEASGLVAGEYGLTVTDVEDTEKVITYQLEEPDKLTLKATVLSPASTGASDGKARVTAAGGTGEYKYSWQNGVATPTADNLSPGFHRVVVTDERGCEASTNFEVTENILPLELELTLEKPVSCAGQDDAVVQASVNGGKPPYQYQWDTENGSGERLSQLGAGTYTLTVTDELGTSKETSVVVPSLEPLEITLTENIPAFGESTNDGKATAAARGGNPPYLYSWDNGEKSAGVENLTIGDHSVTVTDQNGCTASMEFETTERIMKELASGAVSSGQTMNIQKLQFDADSTKIRADARPVLNEIFQFLEQNPTIVVEIGGHTNNLPPPEYCDSLSTARARAVAEYLVNKGIESQRVFYQGYGKRDPLFSNKTADGRRRNQRVEIKILRL